MNPPLIGYGELGQAPRTALEPRSTLSDTSMSNEGLISDSQSSIQNVSPPTSSPSDDLDSLPDSAPSDDIDDEDEEEERISDAEKQWQESLQQMELLLTMVVIPYAGKYFGRRFAYWGKHTCNPHISEAVADNVLR